MSASILAQGRYGTVGTEIESPFVRSRLKGIILSTVRGSIVLTHNITLQRATNRALFTSSSGDVEITPFVVPGIKRRVWW